MCFAGSISTCIVIDARALVYYVDFGWLDPELCSCTALANMYRVCCAGGWRVLTVLVAAMAVSGTDLSCYDLLRTI